MRRERVHVVLMTRINVFMFQGPPSWDRAVLARRLDVFERWTVPSVRRQRELPAVWLVFVDEGTHPEDVRRVERALEGLPARLVTLPSEFAPADYRALIAPLVRTDREVLLTVRLDSDDVLAPTFLRTMRRAVRRTEPHFLNLPRGYRLADDAAFLNVDRSNCFLGFVEPGADPSPRTAYWSGHHRAHEVAPVRQVAPWRAGWTVVIHGDNLESRAGGVRRLPRRWVLRRMGIDPATAASPAGTRPAPAPTA